MSHIGTANRPLDQGLVLDLRMNEGVGTRVLDVSGYRNHGTLLPIGSEPTWVDGKYGKALNFDGINDTVKVLHSSSLNIVGKYITLVAWIKPDSVNTVQRILRKENAYLIEIDTTSLMFYVKSGAGWVNAGWTGFKNLPTGVWYQVAGVYDGTLASNNLKLYVDADLKGVANHQENIDSTNNDLHVGSLGDSNGFMDGIIDEVKIWNRALSGVEVATLYGSRGRI